MRCELAADVSTCRQRGRQRDRSRTSQAQGQASRHDGREGRNL